MRGAKADASQSQPPQRPAATVAAVYQAHSPHNMTTLSWATTAEQLRAVRARGAGGRWRERMEVAEAATHVNTKKVHAPHRRCTARARSRFTSFCISQARTRPPRHTRGTEGRGGRVGCPYAGWVHARRHGGRSPHCRRARTCTVRRTGMRLRRCFFSLTARVTYVPDSGRRGQQPAGAGFERGFAKVLLKDFSAQNAKKSF